MRNVYLLLTALTVTVAITAANPQSRWAVWKRCGKSDSLLSCWDSHRVASVKDELLRRAPEFHLLWVEFQACARQESCWDKGFDAILKERDEMLKRVWPNVCPHLLMWKDWGKANGTTIEKEAFQEVVRGMTPKEACEAHVPRIEFHSPQVGAASFYFKGLKKTRR